MKPKKGSALLLTLFLVSSIMIVAFSGSYIIVSGLRSSGLQYDSARAYFVAESGAEYSLWQVRQNSFDLKGNLYGDIFSAVPMPGTYPAKFTVDYKTWAPIVLTSVGSYGVTQRSVELSF
jgi:hypothetical protein